MSAADPDGEPALRDQLLVFARELGEVLEAERTRRRELEEALDKLTGSYLATIKTLAYVVEAKHAASPARLERTYQYAVALARRVDPVVADDRVLCYGFLLHDVGKVAVPEHILTKAGPLTEEEWDVVRRHPAHGVALLSAMDYLGPALDVIRHHHERWDGAGYPDGLAGEDIPLAARIFAVVDAFSAMTAERPYRKPLPFDAAVDEISGAAGSQLDPLVVQRFVELCDELWPPGLSTR